MTGFTGRIKVVRGGAVTVLDMPVYPGSDTPPVDWNDYRKCSQVCRAEIGQPCFSLSGTIVGGRPDGVRTPLDHPHKARKLRTRKAVR